MGRDLELADRMRTTGLDVVEVAGWQTRGGSYFDPKGFLWHHTAGPLSGNAPSLGVCIYGRAGLSGPLCNLFLARDLTIYVVAAGRANHAGRGAWRGISGNSSVYGLEVENTGYASGPRREPWRKEQVEACCLIAAALPVDADDCCHHKEWTSRKIDMHSLDGNAMRGRVAALKYVPPPPTVQEDDVAVYRQSSERINTKTGQLDPRGELPIYEFTETHYRELTRDAFEKRKALRALGGRPTPLTKQHPWLLGGFVLDYDLIELPKADG